MPAKLLSKGPQKSAPPAHQPAEKALTTFEIEVPPPAPPFRKGPNEAFYLTEPARAELLSLMATPDHDKPYNPEIGDVKLTLDDLKSTVLDYYTRLFALQGATVGERLGELQQSSSPNPLASSFVERSPPPNPSRPGTSHADLLKHNSGNDPKVKSPPTYRPEAFFGDIPPHRAHEHPPQQELDPGLLDPGLLDPRLLDPRLPAPVLYQGQNFFGLCKPTVGPSPAKLVQEHLRAAGLNPIPDPRERTGDLAAPVGSSISELLNAMHKGAAGATEKLDGISRRLLATTEDPESAGWAYASAPPLKRKPRLSGAPHLEQAIADLYAQLFRQVKFNERRIRGLRSRLDLLLRQVPFSEDPRNAL